MKIIFGGTIGRSGLGGQAWATLQYLIGLKELGHDVFYLEDCGESSWVYNWDKEEWTTDLEYPAAYVRDCLEPHGFAGRWLYRTTPESIGSPLSSFLEFCSGADLLVMRAVPLWVWRPEYDLPGRRAFIDVDPGFTQITLANGDAGLAAGIGRCERRFTIAQRIGAPDCAIPETGGPWLKTLPPVALNQWPVVANGPQGFTSVMRWQGFKEVQFNGSSYGQRDKQFPTFIELPRLSSERFCIAVLGIKPEELARYGWTVLPGEIISKTADSYRDFIRQSKAEVAVPKHGYVTTQGGWFSDRSVCYLASGKPVLMTDTGLDWIPTGEGLLTFDSLERATAQVTNIAAHYEKHSRAARALAEHYFSSTRVLPPFLEAAMS